MAASGYHPPTHTAPVRLTSIRNMYHSPYSAAIAHGGGRESTRWVVVPETKDDLETWTPEKVIVCFKLLSKDDKQKLHGTVYGKITNKIAGNIAHCETEFVCKRKRMGGPGSAIDGSGAPPLPPPPPPSSPSASPVSAADKYEYVRTVVTTTTKDGVHAIVRPLPRDESKWILLTLPMNATQMMACYSAQINAIGSGYNDDVEWNMAMQFFFCTCLLQPKRSKTWYCSELVQHSLQGTPYAAEGDARTLQCTPEALHARLAALVKRRKQQRGMGGGVA